MSNREKFIFSPLEENCYGPTGSDAERKKANEMRNGYCCSLSLHVTPTERRLDPNAGRLYCEGGKEAVAVTDAAEAPGSIEID